MSTNNVQFQNEIWDDCIIYDLNYKCMVLIIETRIPIHSRKSLCIWMDEWILISRAAWDLYIHFSPTLSKTEYLGSSQLILKILRY